MLSFFPNQCYLSFLTNVIRLWRVQLDDLLNSFFRNESYLPFLTNVIRLWRVQLGDLQALSLEITPWTLSFLTNVIFLS